MANGRRKTNLKIDKKAVIFLAIGFFAFLGLFYFYSFGNNAPTGSALQTAQRPKYCTTNNNVTYCIPDDVFTYLPPYPRGMNTVTTRIETSSYPIMENFAAVPPLCNRWNSDYTQCLDFPSDENYYLQPEFFYTTWYSQGAPLYYELGNPQGYSYTYIGVTGAGAFPNAVIVRPTDDSPVKPGTDLKSITYFYTGWLIQNYQGMKLNIYYPKSGETAIGTFKVENQDPNVVKKYFTISITPDEFVLGRTFPIFETEKGCIKLEGYQPPCRNWVQKVTINIHINDGTPPGKYVIAINPVAPSKQNQLRWSNMYGFRYFNYGGFGVEPPMYQMFIEVS